MPMDKWNVVILCIHNKKWIIFFVHFSSLRAQLNNKAYLIDGIRITATKTLKRWNGNNKTTDKMFVLAQKLAWNGVLKIVFGEIECE